MDEITVYTKPACVHRDFARIGSPRNGIHRRPTSPKILRLMRHSDSGEYLRAPVVVAGDAHWSGFRPDRLKALANQALLATDATATAS